MQPRIGATKLTTLYGDFVFHCFSWGEHEEDNVLCLSTDGMKFSNPLCRIQSACYTAEIFRSLDCDCHEQLETSLTRIGLEGGILIYMLCDGRGAGLYQKTLGLELWRTQGLDTAEAYRLLGLPEDPRNYEHAAYVLKEFGISQVRLMTNNPRKITGIVTQGFRVTREQLEIPAKPKSEPYLKAKKEKLGHLLAQFEPPISRS